MLNVSFHLDVIPPTRSLDPKVPLTRPLSSSAQSTASATVLGATPRCRGAWRNDAWRRQFGTSESWVSEFI